MSILILLSVVILAIASITIKKTVPAMIAFAMMMFMLGIYYMVLDEKLLGLLQVFVYTGGIVVLMLFGITVIGPEFPEAKKRPWAIVSTLLVAVALAYLVLVLFPDQQTIAADPDDQAKIFAEHYADFALIFALVGSSLLYGTMKVAKLLTAKRSYDDV